MLGRTKKYQKRDNLRPRKPKKALGANVSNWGNDRLEEVLNHPLHMGVDGKDYGPIAHLLQDEYNRRFSKRHEEQLKQDEKDWQAWEDHVEKRKIKLRELVGEWRKSGKVIPYHKALPIAAEIEYITGNEVCPFVWAVYVNEQLGEVE